MMKSVAVSFLFLSLVSIEVGAMPNSNITSSELSTGVTRRQWLVGVESGGVLKHSTSRAEENGEGLEFGVKAVRSFSWLALDFDLTGGWRVNKLQEENALVTTRAFFSEFVARRPVTQRWSVGPMVSALVGRDVSFSDFGTNSDKKMFSLFAGGKALYEIPLESLIARVGMQVQTDLNIGDRQITQFQLVAEFGWPTDGATAPAALVPVKTFNLTRSGLNFNLDSIELSTYSRNMLKNLGRILNAYPEQWSSVAVIGHTDTQGTRTYNLKLSQDRASEVQRNLADAGVPFGRMLATGYGPDRPLEFGEEPEVHAKNRRVELVIKGLKEGTALSEEIGRVLR